MASLGHAYPIVWNGQRNPGFAKNREIGE